MELDRNKIQYLLRESLSLLRRFDFIIDSYILDFYVKDHWMKLPDSWRENFELHTLNEFADLLNPSSNIARNMVWPLSLLALRNIIWRLSFNRNFSTWDNKSRFDISEFYAHPKLNILLSKNLKYKKKHEIDQMAEICAENARKMSTCFVVDFGAGLGHLARRLSYQHSLKVCCIEMNEQLNQEARRKDEEYYQKGVQYLNINALANHTQPVHVTMKLTDETTEDSFLQLVKNALNQEYNPNFSFGIVGLHPCGNLSAVLVNMFVKIPEAKFLAIVGCCYMKLTTDCENDVFTGYPLSQYLRESGRILHKLSYEARELACHAIEKYYQKLQNGDYDTLKVHAYRAAIERIIVRNRPELKHMGLRNVKCTPCMTFAEYANLSTSGLEINISKDDLVSHEILMDLKVWHRVVSFYVLRLMFAPLIESVILYDRLLHLIENETTAYITPIFDPVVSPRNLILTALKR